MPSPATDDALLQEIREARATGRPYQAALGELCERWRHAAEHIIRSVQRSYSTGSSADAEDLFQDSVARFTERGLDQLRGNAARAFFLRVVKHLAIDHCRRNRSFVEPTPSPASEEPRDLTAGNAVARHESENRRREAQDIYWGAFRRLETEHPLEAQAWDVYHHRELGDHEACAAELGISVANSYKRVSRAQAHLRLYLLELEEEVP
jgi:RNA polymerase sigma-70 factor (ECF subfamily)